MSKDDFSKLASPYLPESKLEEFTENTFKLFDEDQDGLLDFGEFALAALAIETKDSRERLVWTFDRIFDQASGACASAQEAIIFNQSKHLKWVFEGTRWFWLVLLFCRIIKDRLIQAQRALGKTQPKAADFLVFLTLD